jgi:hypothetical protein
LEVFLEEFGYSGAGEVVCFDFHRACSTNNFFLTAGSRPILDIEFSHSAVGSSTSAALFEFLLAAAGAGIVTTDSGGIEIFGVGFVGKAIAANPESAFHADAARRVIDAFFVRAAEDSVGEDALFDAMFLEKCGDFLGNGGVAANVLRFGEPFSDGWLFLGGVLENSDDELGGALVVGSVRSESGERVLEF